MTNINLKLSTAAKQHLLRFMSEIEYDDPVAAVIWHEGGESQSPDGVVRPISAGWGVGWYNPTNLSGEPIQEIEGIRFVFGQGEKSEELNGKVLDVKNGAFIVIDAT